VAIFTSADYLDPASRIRGYYVGGELTKNGFKVVIFPCKRFEGSLISLIIHSFNIFLMSIYNTLRLDKDFIIYIQRGIGSISPLLFIYVLIIKYLFHRKIVYDIDDALFLYNKLSINNIIRHCDVVIVGGYNLKNYAEKLNKNVFYIPTSISSKITDDLWINKVKKKKNDKLVIGFIGSTSTTRYLSLLVTPISVLANEYDFEFRIISAKSYEEYDQYKILYNKFKKNGVDLKYVLWGFSNEETQLTEIDIGLAPLFNGIWEKNKCGFKVINYMSAGIPPVVSAVGEHKYIIQDGFNGFLCDNDQKWINSLRKLIEDKSLRQSIGQNARKTFEERYSLEKNVKILANILSKIS